MLTRVQPEHAGRLVLIEAPARPLRMPDGAIPLWRVYVLGRPLWIGDDERDTVLVAEPCLTPVTRLGKRAARRLVVAQAQRDADAIVAQIGRLLSVSPPEAGEFDAALERAARESLARLAAPPVLLPVDR
jgi:hypothetical protein